MRFFALCYGNDHGVTGIEIPLFCQKMQIFIFLAPGNLKMADLGVFDGILKCGFLHYVMGTITVSLASKSHFFVKKCKFSFFWHR